MTHVESKKALRAHEKIRWMPNTVTSATSTNSLNPAVAAVAHLAPTRTKTRVWLQMHLPCALVLRRGIAFVGRRSDQAATDDLLRHRADWLSALCRASDHATHMFRSILDCRRARKARPIRVPCCSHEDSLGHVPSAQARTGRPSQALQAWHATFEAERLHERPERAPPSFWGPARARRLEAQTPSWPVTTPYTERDVSCGATK